MEELTALIQRAQKGDPEAYGELVNRFQDMSYGYAYACLGDFQLAQDAAQEAFIEAYQCLPTLREAHAFPAWFRRIVFKHCDRLIRGKRLDTLPLESAAEAASPHLNPAEILELREVGKRVQSAIHELPLKEREVTTLFYIDGYSQQEIADFLDVPAKTVKSRLYASRQRLKERILNMVQDELKTNPLPEGFSQQTLEQAIARAKVLNEEQHYDQAEQVLRQALARSPEHPEALRLLNRTLMQGRVFGQGRWDLLPELVRQGEMILRASDDETIHQEQAKTLLAIPAMPEAIAFIEGWIVKKCPSLERLGMLAWAKGCVADYAAAESLWQELLALARHSSTEDLLRFVPFAAYTLVDCFAEAGELALARRVAQEAWELCQPLGPLPDSNAWKGDAGWAMIFRKAGLEYQDIARQLLERHARPTSISDQITALCLRCWIDEPQEAVAAVLEWACVQIASGNYQNLEQTRFTDTLRVRGLWVEANQLAQDVWETLRKIDTPEAEKASIPWDWDRFNPVGFIEGKDWEAAEVLSSREIQERGVKEGSWAIVVAAGSGKATPPELVQAVAQGGIESVDEYGLFGWYLVAREAAAAGDPARAFEALEKSLAYWANAPYWYVKLWENDLRWGELREHPEFKRLFSEKRQRIGPIYGQLHYFPGW